MPPDDPTDDELQARINPHDPLGVDALLEARQDWDAQLEADRRRWDEIAPLRGESDDLVERTDNGLRPADVELEQPPQSPAWTPPEDVHS